jgi:hypothetical protein
LGQDVKALVLISPTLQYEGLSNAQAFRTPVVSEVLDLELIYGEKAKSARDMARIVKQLERARGVTQKPRRPRRGEAEETADSPPKEAEGDEGGLSVVKLDTEDAGMTLLAGRQFSSQVGAAIEKFLVQYLENRKTPWLDRTSPLK